MLALHDNSIVSCTYVYIVSEYIHTQIHVNVGRGRDKGIKALALLEALIEALLNRLCKRHYQRYY